MGDNMRALVTGASSGIGRDMAYYLGELGYDVILVSRDKESLMKVAAKIKTKTKVMAYDLSKTENCYKLFEEVKGIVTIDDINKIKNISIKYAPSL